LPKHKTEWYKQYVEESRLARAIPKREAARIIEEYTRTGRRSTIAVIESDTTEEAILKDYVRRRKDKEDAKRRSH
jgi:hypothetical protein